MQIQDNAHFKSGL